MNGSGRSESRQQEISEISRSLKALARELSVPVIALSQLSRQVEQRPDHRPMLSDLRESGSIEQDADIVMMLYRPDYYKGEKEDEEQGAAEQQENANIAEVIVVKNRHGETGTVNFVFDGEHTLFLQLEKIHDD